jgi:hypothetical protein
MELKKNLSDSGERERKGQKYLQKNLENNIKKSIQKMKPKSY